MPSATSGFTNAYFGFDNAELDTIEIPVGADNSMSPPPIDRSQTEVFFNRRSRHFPLTAFYAPFASSGQLTWQLNGYEVTATAKDNICKTDWMSYQVVILQDRKPSDALIGSMVGLTQELLGTADDQITAQLGDSSPTFYQIVVNVTTVEGSLSPMAVLINLFGNTELYDQYVLELRSLGLVVSEIDTMATGLEKEGKAITAGPSPTPSPPQAPSAPSPLPPKAPSAPTTPTPSTPTSPNEPIDNSHGPSAPQMNPSEPSFGAPPPPIFSPSNGITMKMSLLLIVLALFSFVLMG